MACPKGGVHDFELQEGKQVCQKCGHIAEDSPSYAELLKHIEELNRIIEEQDRFIETKGLGPTVTEWEEEMEA